ncbi:MAG: hypothetical protein JWQ63_3870 [Mucilaginibacter sp.]|jgi:hypothetical protein|nr:hypothetical protein [Mucilaginibacter sp.]
MIELLNAESNGNYFKDIFNWWDITEIIAFLSLIIYLIKRKHKKKGKYI